MAQALFANQRETNLASTTVLVEAVLEELGYHPPQTRRIELSGAHVAWRIQKGSAIATVALLERPDFTHLRVMSVVMTLDAKVDRGSLFSHVLALNTELCGNAFALDGNHLLLVAERSTLDIDRSEIMELVRRVTTNADQYDDALVAQYGGTMGGELG